MGRPDSEIAALRRAGYWPCEIAEHLGLERKCVHVALGRAGLAGLHGEDSPTHRPLLTTEQVAQKVGLSRYVVARLQRGGAFPAPIKLARRLQRYCAVEVAAWIAARQPAPDLLARMMEKVEFDTNGGCWLWSGGGGAYGQAHVTGKRLIPHRAVWLLHGLALPEGALLRHRCDTPRCVNPAHMDPGTHKDNSGDMVARGRSLAGTRHRCSKLSETDVRAIRRRFDGGEPITSIAKDFGVVRQACGYVATRKSYANVEDRQAS